MNKEELIKLSNQLRKRYFCANFGKLNKNKVIVNEDYTGKDNNVMNILEIEKKTETEKATTYFEKITEEFIRFINEKNIEKDVTKFKVSILVSYFLETNLKDNLTKEKHRNITYNYIDKSNLKKNNFLNNKIKIVMSINEDMSMLDEKSFDKFRDDFIFTPYFIVDYNEFVKNLTNLGYDVKYQNFDELLDGSITNYETTLELTTIDLEPEKVLKK